MKPIPELMKTLGVMAAASAALMLIVRLPFRVRVSLAHCAAIAVTMKQYAEMLLKFTGKK